MAHWFAYTAGMATMGKDECPGDMTAEDYRNKHGFYVPLEMFFLYGFCCGGV
jgi:hypothetical protein